MKLFLKRYYIMTNDSNIDFEMNSTPNPLEKILFLITAAIILDKCFITVVLYPLATWREHLFLTFYLTLFQDSKLWRFKKIDNGAPGEV